jgi:hypothetical protein
LLISAFITAVTAVLRQPGVLELAQMLKAAVCSALVGWYPTVLDAVISDWEKSGESTLAGSSVRSDSLTPRHLANWVLSSANPVFAEGGVEAHPAGKSESWRFAAWAAVLSAATFCFDDVDDVEAEEVEDPEPELVLLDPPQA